MGMRGCKLGQVLRNVRVNCLVPGQKKHEEPWAKSRAIERANGEGNWKISAINHSVLPFVLHACTKGK